MKIGHDVSQWAAIAGVVLVALGYWRASTRERADLHRRLDLARRDIKYLRQEVKRLRRCTWL